MAFSLGDRLQPPQKYFALLDPGAYQHECAYVIKLNKAPFLSNTPRNTQTGGKVWTDALYDANIPHSIPNCTSLRSKRPRFPYEAFSKEDLEEILCRCGIQRPCECPTGEEEQEVICQGKVRRRLFKGPPPRRVSSDEGLSVPSKTDQGFEVLPDGSKRRLRKEILDESPPFYDARVNELTAFYQGCKWSRWSAKRSQKSLEVRPGPADYTIERPLTETDICQEKVREFKRKTSKQPRFIEIIQERNISEGRPGPTTYSPTLPKGTDLQFLGPKGERYPRSKYEIHPGPSDYFVRRDFDEIEIPEKPCHAKLPERACFGIKALRFKPRREEGPSPASYNAVYKPEIMHCSKAPFGISSIRFKDAIYDERDEDEFDECLTNKIEEDNEPCPSHTWEFKSKTTRIKPLEKKLDEPSPADLPQGQINVKRPPKLQYLAPFYSSEGRFQPWYNWIAVQGKQKSPGPCYYHLEKPRCYPAVHFGPLFRARRFSCIQSETPAPNEYEVGGGTDVILKTYNKRLLENIANKHKFHWEPPQDTRTLSCEEKENILLQKSIALLDVDEVNDNKNSKSPIPKASSEPKKSKLLKCFVYSNKVPPFF